MTVADNPKSLTIAGAATLMFWRSAKATVYTKNNSSPIRHHRARGMVAPALSVPAPTALVC